MCDVYVSVYDSERSVLERSKKCLLFYFAFSHLQTFAGWHEFSMMIKHLFFKRGTDSFLFPVVFNSRLNHEGI